MFISKTSLSDVVKLRFVLILKSFPTVVLYESEASIPVLWVLPIFVVGKLGVPRYNDKLGANNKGASSKKSSFEITHPNEAEGKNPNLLFVPNDVDPSTLPVKEK